MATLKSIYGFQDYRAFLKHYGDFQKAERRLTYGQISRKAGLGSENYFQMVVRGRRNLTVENIHQFAVALGLSDSEHRYFELLVHENQAKKAAVKVYYADQLKLFKKSAQLGRATARLPELLSSWTFAGVVAVLLSVPDGADPAELKRMTGLAPEKIADVLDVLRRRDLLVAVEGERVRLDDKYLAFNAGQSFNFDRFQSSQIARALDALKKRQSNGAKFYAQTFTIAAGGLARYGERIRKFLEDLMEESNSDAPEELAQLNIQLFPYRG